MLALRERLTDPEIEKLASEGAVWTDDRAVEFAMSM